MQLRSKLFLVFFLLAVVPLTGLTLYSYYTSERAYCQAVLDEAAQLAESMGSRVHLVQRDLDRRLRSMGSQPFYTMLSEKPGDWKPEIYRRLVQDLGSSAAMIEAIEVDPQAAGLAPVVPASAGIAPPRRPGPPPLPQTQVYIKMPGEQADSQTGSAPTDPNSAVIEIPDSGRLMVHSLPPPPPQAGSGETKPGSRRNEVHLRWIERQIKEARRAAEQGMAEAKRQIREENIAALQQSASLEGLTVHAFMKPQRQGEEKRVECLDLTANLAMPNEGEAKVVAQINAKAILGAALSRVPRDEGEIAFALDPGQNLYTLNPEAYATLQKLGIDWSTYPESGAPPEDWIVASKKDPQSGVLFGIAKPIGDGLREIRRAAVYNLGIGLGLVFVALIGIVPLSRRLTRNLTVLTDGVERLAEGRLETRVPEGSSDELGRLSRAFNHMAGQLAENQSRLVEQERIRKELEMCRELQKEMLPRGPLRLPFGEVSGVSIPAREVGGDFFNYFALPDGRVALLIGDVSGKGVAAALLMANVQATLKARLTVRTDLALLFSELDDEIAQATPPETYFTLFVGVLDDSSHTLRWVNAGHNTQYLLRADGSLEMMASSGRPIGLLPGSDYRESSIDLEPGDSIFLYTDGLVEAEDSQGNDFGEDRLEQTLSQERSSASDTILSRVEEVVRRHRGSRENLDDATMLVFKTQ